MDSGASLEEADNDGDASNTSSRALKTPARLEYLANLLMMPENMCQYGILLRPPSAKGRAASGSGTFIKKLVEQINEEDHAVMGHNKIGETALKNWITELKILAINHENWIKEVGAKARNTSVQPPSHQRAAWELMEQFKDYQPPSQSNRYTKPPPGMDHLTLIKDNNAALPTGDEQNGGKEAQEEAAAKVKENRVRRKLEESECADGEHPPPKRKVLKPAPDVNPSEDSFAPLIATLIASDAMTNYREMRKDKIKEIQDLSQLKKENKEDPTLYDMFDRQLKEAMAELQAMKPPNPNPPNLHAGPAIGPLSPTTSTGSMSIPSPSASAPTTPGPVLGGFGSPT